ncbi:MAG TPA: lysophospholipid acyltransferase family protein [Ignavibacteriaceae bacterium]|nr:lysophospholipid acyltransferase family protein [Ignavibacteriaceae bacterium]
MKKSFGNFYLINSPPSLSINDGLIVTPNHFSWWDGFFIDFISRRYYLGRKFYIMMLEEQLTKYGFFKYLGAYSIKLSNPKSIIETIDYTRKLIEDENSFVVVYPQGEIQPFDIEPIEIKKGLRNITKGLKKQTFVLPIAFKVQYDNQQTPDVYVRFGELVNVQTVHKNYDSYFEYFVNNIKQCSKEATYKNKSVNLFE